MAKRKSAAAVPDLVYSGTKLTWDGVGEWNASSGLPDYQEPKFQNLRDKGPIPEGLYSVPLTLGGDARVTSTKKDKAGNLVEATLDTRPVIESLTCIKHPYEKGQILIFENWGSNRVRLEKIRLKHANTSHRAGFYLHDSNKGYSHGCIEVDTDFFRALREFSRKEFGSRKHLLLKVEYVGDTTYGNTLKDKEVVMHCD